MVSAKVPTAVACGAILPRTGIGFSSVTVTLAETFESAAVTALTVTVFGLGKPTRGVKRPAELIIPVAALPPLTPFTNHATDVFAESLTVALNCCEPSIRTLAELGEIDTVMPGGGELVPPDLPEFAVSPTQPTWTEVQTRRKARVSCRTISLRV